MKKYKALYARTETRVIEIECEAMNEDEASDKFDEMIEDNLCGDAYHFDYDDMKCVHAEDDIQNIEEIK